MGGQYLRLLCHFLTTLPVPKEYLYSPYDWPQCFWILSGTAPESETEGFALFFSGHVANIKILSEYFRNKGEVRNAIIFECFNAFQVIRILATRGHYSIDIITGYIAGYVVSEIGKRFDLKYNI